MDNTNGASAQVFFSQLNNLSLKEAGHIATIVARAGEGWFELDSVASALEENKKSFIAKIVLEHLDSGLPGSKPGQVRPMPVSQAETRAMGDPRVEEYVKAMVEARRKANLARVKYDMGRVFIDMQRSNAANERQEMQFSRNGQ